MAMVAESAYAPLVQWQARLDGVFPGGVMGFAQPQQPGDEAAPIVWLRVIAMAGLDPVLNMYTEPVVLAGRVLTSWVVESHKGGIARVSATFAPPFQDYVFVTPPEPLATELAKARAELQAAWEAAEQ